MTFLEPGPHHPTHESALLVAHTLYDSGLNPTIYRVAGSAIMGLYGIRRPADVDIVMRPYAYDRLAGDACSTSDGNERTFTVLRTEQFSLATHLKSTTVPPHGLGLDIHTVWDGGLEEREIAYYERFANIPSLTWEFTINEQTFSFESLTLPQLYQSKFFTPRLKDWRDRRRIRHSGLTYK